jgi:prepilin-type processing-associated H-X9-DG protein
VSENGLLSIANSSFKENGITGEPGNSNSGLISVQNSAKATLTNVTFESNRQGITTSNGGTVTISGCHFTNTGIRTDNENLLYYSNVVSSAGQGSSVTINQGTTITNSASNGIAIVQGAQLFLDDVSVEGSNYDGLLVGNENGGGTVDIRRGKFIRNQTGIRLTFGSTGTIQESQILNNATTGIVLTSANTKGTISNTEFHGNKGVGLWIDGHAEGVATGCTFDGNERGGQVGDVKNADQLGILTLENCTIMNSSICGIAACMKSTVLLRGVRFANNHNLNISKDRDTNVRDESKYVR